MNIGVPTYGRSFTLVSSDEHGFGAPASGTGPAGTYTGEGGFNSYYEVHRTVAMTAMW